MDYVGSSSLNIVNIYVSTPKLFCGVQWNHSLQLNTVTPVLWTVLFVPMKSSYIFLKKIITCLFWTSVNTDSRHFSMSQVTNSYRSSTSFYGHYLHGHCTLSILSNNSEGVYGYCTLFKSLQRVAIIFILYLKVLQVVNPIII